MAESTPCKKVGPHIYYYLGSIEGVDSALRSRVDAAVRIAAPSRFNVIKLSNLDDNITLLDYAQFHDEAFPALDNSWTIDFQTQTYRHRTYADSLNPPILHRKELLLTHSHPQYQTYRSLTVAAEQLGLFDDPHRIGFKRAWDALLANRGYKVVGHQLIPIGNDESSTTDASDTMVKGVARHLTALSRTGLSAPIQALFRFGCLDGSRTVLDYGCGRGDDIRGLRESNIDAAGWDPHYAPDGPRRPAHIVNLGFVINVIENFDERVEAVRIAWSFAQELLVVSAMLVNQQSINGVPYGDGVLTSRSTFQRYYTQGELRAFLNDILGEEPIAVGPGIFFVFKDKDAEQRFMYGRFENRRNILRLSRMSSHTHHPRPSRAERMYEQHRELLEALWVACLSYGRDPERGEIQDVGEVIAAFGSLPAALRFIRSRKENVEACLHEARCSRMDNLRLYMAQMQFEKRKPYSHLEARLKKDIRTFFGDYRAAADAGRALLFSVSNIEAISDACQLASQQGIGWLEESESLQLHTSLVERLPAILRAYIHCGTHLYGDVSSADLIKIHIRSGKLTLMKFDDFVGRPLPRMIQRVKLNLRKQDLEIFDYSGNYEPPYLFRKSRFINEEFPNYAEQLAIEEFLNSLGLTSFTGYGPSASEFDSALQLQRYVIDGYTLLRSVTIPDLDAPCGRYLTYRQLIECGETQARTGIDNKPKEPDSYTALLELAKNVLDPLIEYFGMVQLTYGFCSKELAKAIPSRIAPALDQHAAHERKRNGEHICSRLGAACDLLVEDEDMLSVVRWIEENLPYDRLYYIDGTRPIHVSYSANPLGQTVMLAPGKGGNLVPRVVRRSHPS